MFKLIFAALSAASLADCATITRGKNDVLVVQSSPSGAQVELSDGQTCNNTPCTFKLPRKSELNVLIKKDGCEAQQVRVTNKVSGAGVDASTGAMLELIPNPVDVTLSCRK